MTTETNDPDAFTPEEQAYLESGGEPVQSEEALAVEEAGAEKEAENLEAASEEGGDVQPDDAEGEPKKSDTVPHGAFHAKNEELKATKAKLRELETQMAVVNDRFERFNQMQAEQQRPQEPEEEIPGDDDPFGKIAYLEKQVAQLKQGTEQQQQLTQQQKQLEDFKQAVSWEEQQFVQEVPDYTNASQFLGEHILKSLAARGFQGPQLKERYQNELLGIALDAKEAGRRVPDVIYQMAQEWGYSQPKPEPDPVQEQSAQAKETLEKVAKGQQANKTPGNGSGATGGKMTLERFANMPEAEAFAWMEKNPEGYSRLMGS